MTLFTSEKKSRQTRICFINGTFHFNIKGPVRPANGYVTQRKRTKHAEFGYLVEQAIFPGEKLAGRKHTPGLKRSFAHQ